jgi:hypothetical protein
MSQFTSAYMLVHWTKGSSLSWNYKTKKPKDNDTTSVGAGILDCTKYQSLNTGGYHIFIDILIDTQSVDYSFCENW